MADTANRLGKRLRSLRNNKKLTLDQLADQSGISAKHIGKVERGESKISVEWLEKIAAALEVDVRDILDAEHEQSRNALVAEITSFLPKLSDKDTQIVYRLVKMLAGH